MAAFGEACNSPLPSYFIGLFSLLSSIFDAGKKSTQRNTVSRRLSVSMVAFMTALSGLKLPLLQKVTG
jgi:hypothetical protein